MRMNCKIYSVNGRWVTSEVSNLPKLFVTHMFNLLRFPFKILILSLLQLSWRLSDCPTWVRQDKVLFLCYFIKVVGQSDCVTNGYDEHQSGRKASASRHTQSANNCSLASRMRSVNNIKSIPSDQLIFSQVTRWGTLQLAPHKRCWWSQVIATSSLRIISTIVRWEARKIIDETAVKFRSRLIAAVERVRLRCPLEEMLIFSLPVYCKRYVEDMRMVCWCVVDVNGMWSPHCGR